MSKRKKEHSKQTIAKTSQIDTKNGHIEPKRDLTRTTLSPKTEKKIKKAQKLNTAFKHLISIFTLTRAIQGVLGDEDALVLSVMVKKNDQRYFEIWADSPDQTVKLKGSWSLMDELRSNKNYVGVPNNKEITIHTSSSVSKIADCTFFELGYYQESFFEKVLKVDKHLPRNMLLCLKRFAKVQKSSKSKEDKFEAKTNSVVFETQMWLYRLREEQIYMLRVDDSISCRLPEDQFDVTNLKDFVFAYKGGNPFKPPKTDPKSSSSSSKPPSSSTGQKTPSGKKPEVYGPVLPKEPTVDANEGKNGQKSAQNETEIGIFIEKPQTHGDSETTLKVHYLTYNAHNKTCNLSRKDYSFYETKERLDQKMTYKIINGTLFFSKKNRVPSEGPQVTSGRLDIYYLPSNQNSAKKLNSGKISMSRTRMIELKSSVEVAELLPDKAFFILIGNSQKTIITITEFSYDNYGDATLGNERLMRIPEKLSDVSDRTHPVMFMTHYTPQRNLMIFNQDRDNQAISVRFCSFYYVDLQGKILRVSGVESQPETPKNSNSQKPENSAKTDQISAHNLTEKLKGLNASSIFINCSLDANRISIVTSFKPRNFFMKESSYVGNLASFDFVDQFDSYVYTTNIYHYYPDPKNSSDVDNVRLVTTFNSINRIAARKRNLATHNSRKTFPYINTISSYSLGYDDVEKQLFGLKRAPLRVPILNYHHTMFEYMEKKNLRKLNFTLKILPSPSSQYLPKLLGGEAKELDRHREMTIVINLVDSCLSRVDYRKKGDQHTTESKPYVGGVVRIQSRVSNLIAGSLLGFSLKTPKSARRDFEVKNGNNTKDGGGPRPAGVPIRPGEPAKKVIRDGTHLNFNIIKSNKIVFVYPNTLKNVVVDDIYHTGKFIFGVESKFSLFPMNCQQYLVQDQNDYNKYKISTSDAFVVNKYVDQIYYEFRYVMYCRPKQIFSKIDFSKVIIKEMKSTPTTLALHCKNLTVNHGSFIYISVNRQSDFESKIKKIPFYDFFDRFELLDAEVTRIRQTRVGLNPKVTLTKVGVKSSLIFFYRSEEFSKKFRTKDNSTWSLSSEGLDETEKGMDFAVRVVYLETHYPSQEKAGEYPRMAKVPIKEGLEHAKRVRCLKKVVLVSKERFNQTSIIIGYNLLAVFGCQGSNLMMVEIFFSTKELTEVYLSFSKPRSTRVSLAYKIDPKKVLHVCLTNSNNLLFWQDGEIQVSGKILVANFIRNNYDFDVGRFSFEKILRMFCVPEFEVAVIFGQIRDPSNPHKLTMGVLTLKLSDMFDYRNRLFDYYTLDFVPFSIQNHVRVYPVYSADRPILVIMVKYMRGFYTRRLLLDGPDIYITPRNEAITEGFGSSSPPPDEVQFMVQYYYNNSLDYVSANLSLKLKTGSDQLSIKPFGHKMVIVNDGGAPPPQPTTSSGDGGKSTNSSVSGSSKASSSGAGSGTASSAKTGGLQQKKSSTTSSPPSSGPQEHQSSASSASSTTASGPTGKASQTRNSPQKRLPSLKLDRNARSKQVGGRSKPLTQLQVPFYLLQWQSFPTKKHPQFSKSQTYKLSDLATIEGHVTHISIDLASQDNSPDGTKPREQVNPSGETGLISRASIQKVKAHFVKKRLNYIPLRPVDIPRNSLKLGQKSPEPQCMKIKETKDITGNTLYLAAWCYRNPSADIIWFSPMNQRQEPVMLDQNFEFVNKFDFFMTKDRFVYTTIHRKSLSSAPGGTAPNGAPAGQQSFDIRTPMFILTEIGNLGVSGVVDRLGRKSVYVMYGTGDKPSGGIRNEESFNSQKIGGEILDLKTWSSPLSDKEKQIIFMLISSKGGDADHQLLVELRKYEIDVQAAVGRGSPVNPFYWYSEKASSIEFGAQGIINSYYFIEANSRYFWDSTRKAEIDNNNPIYIYCFSRSDSDVEVKLISSTHGMKGRQTGQLSPAIRMDDFKTSSEPLKILPVNDCKEVRWLVISCVQADNDQSILQILYFEVITSAMSAAVQLKVLEVKSYLKHQRERYLAIRQGFKYFGALINPANTDDAGIYIYKKVEYGGSMHVYYFLGLSEFVNQQDYNKVNFYFKSRNRRKSQKSTLVDYDEVLVVYSAKKNVFMHYNLTEFEMGFDGDTEQKDLDGYNLVVRNTQSMQKANLSKLFEAQVVQPSATGSVSSSKGKGSAYPHVIVIFLFIVGASLIPLGCYYWSKRRDRLEMERIHRDEDIIYDLDDFRF